jgi:hypothetical protein
MINGDLKSLLLLWENLASNQRYSDFLLKEDFNTFRRRSDQEGLTFLTSTLPLIGKALDSFHSTLEWKSPEGFKTRVIPQLKLWNDTVLNDVSIPLFLGVAIENALKGNSIAVDCVRQLSYIFYKLEVDYGEEKEREYLINFRKIDNDISFVFNVHDTFRDSVIGKMGLLIKRILCNLDPFDIVPSHGSGATACRTPNWKKHHRPLVFYEKLDNAFPYSDYFFFSYTHLSDAYERLRDSLPKSVPQARVCLVPKDSRGPRIISCEPAELMFIQQGIMRKLYSHLETHHLTAGQINFTDQSINRNLALLASKGERDLATIDLSDASDRVSLELIRRTFPENWFEALTSCRSEETILPDGEVVKLNKFAPMGSSCCFPVEALCFWACVQASIQILLGSNSIKDVFVYGDDILVASVYYEAVKRGLESIGLAVNSNKSYWKGPFRESCGGDYHFGYDVTPVRVRKYLSKSRTSVTTNADLINTIVGKFGYESVHSVISVIETTGEYSYPRSTLQLPDVVRYAPRASNDVFFQRRWNVHLQRFEYRILRCISRSKERQPPNWEELFRKQLSKARQSSNPRNAFDCETSLEPYSFPLTRNETVPGWYTDSHSVVTKWVWTWLG